MIAKWIVVAWIAFGVLLTVGSVGKPRVHTPGTAALAVGVNGALIAAIVVFWR